jgi:calcium-dependent protein kinase
MNILKREAFKVIARSLPPMELAGMREVFQEMDEDESGTITVDELRQGLRKRGAEVALSEVQHILNDIDLDGNSKVCAGGCTGSDPGLAAQDWHQVV